MDNLFLIAAHASPVVLITLVIILPDLAIMLSALAGATATFGGWYLKFVVITRAAYIPKFEIPTLPIRGQPGSG